MADDEVQPEYVNTGTYDDDGTGDNLRAAFDKGNTNFLTIARFLNRRDNPQEVTAHQAGAYTQAEVDALIADLGRISDLLVLLGQIHALASGVTSDRTAVAGDRTVVEAAQTSITAAVTLVQGIATALSTKLIVSPNPPTGGNDGDIWFQY